MKLIKAFAITASIGAAIFFSPSSKAQTPGGWFYGGTSNDGHRLYIKPEGCNENNICRAIGKHPELEYRVLYDCNKWRSLTSFSKEKWEEIMPGTIDDDWAKIACGLWVSNQIIDMDNIVMGYVYVATHTNTKELTKIGITRRPENRIDQLGGNDLTVHAMMVCLNPEQTEKDLHAKFKEFRVPQSEWFNLTEEHLEEVFHRLELEHKQAISYMKELISHIVKPDSKSSSINQIESQAASPPPPIPTPSGEPEWDRNYQKWRYMDKDGLVRESDSYQEALNNKESN